MVEKAKYPYEGYNLYIVMHKKMGRRMANLVNPNNRKDRTTISYARYLMSVHLGRFLNKDETVDHINEDKLDDRIENYQILSRLDNKAKSQSKARLFEFVCPVCNSSFTLTARQSYKKENPSCSNKCKYEKQRKVK